MRSHRKNTLLAFGSRLLVAGVALSFATTSLAYTTQPIADPPTYLGSLGGQPACGTAYGMSGFEPVDPGAPQAKYPVFIYFVGTWFSPDPAPPVAAALAPRTVAQAMAERGFVAVAVEYDNAASYLDVILGTPPFSAAGFHNKLACMFGSGNAESLVAALCSRSNADCTKGIATWGHSQGAVMAVGAARFDRRVRASFATGASGPNVAGQSYNRIRLVNGEFDLNGNTAEMSSVVGVVPAQDCPGSVDQCLRADGSGWKLIRQSEMAQNKADHCWFTALECDGLETLEPNWTPGTSAVFSLAASADWLASAAVQPRGCPSPRFALRTQPNAANATTFVSARLWSAGVPVEAVGWAALEWERFTCLEKGNGQIVLRAANDLYVAAGPSSQQLSATSVPADATVFEVIPLGGDTIALQSVSTGKYVGANPDAQPRLAADRTAISSTETFTVFPQ